MKKAPEAFRTISEVSDLLETPAHVLRFWESKFYQIRPVKRAGGRRYYRPDDVALINGIRLLLQDGGLTIRGVQRILQEKGVRHLIDMGSDLPIEAEPLTQDAALAPPDAGTGDQAEAPQPVPPKSRPPIQPLRPAWPLQIMPEHEELDDIPVRSEPHPAAATLPVSAPSPQATATPADAAPLHGGPEADKPAAQRRSANRPTPPAVVKMPDDLAEDELAAALPPRLPHLLRNMHGELPARLRDRAVVVARRLDAILDRMSDASGAGRW